MAEQADEDEYGPAEAQQRFEAPLRDALKTPDKPLKEKNYETRFARQRRNRRASRDKSRLVRLTIRQPLAFRPLHGNVYTFPIFDAERNAV